jgi:hypothetical protein
VLDSMSPVNISSGALQALDLFRKRTGSRQHYKVHLEKKVPHGDSLPAHSWSHVAVICFSAVSRLEVLFLNQRYN